MKHLLILSILFNVSLSLAQTLNPTPPSDQLEPFFPSDDSGITEAFYCSMGDAEYGCRSMDGIDLVRLDGCTTQANLGAGSVGAISAMMMNSYGEVLYFQELAERSVGSIQCQLQILRAQDRALLADAAWRAYDSQQELLQRLVQKKRELEVLKRSPHLRSTNTHESASTAVYAARRGVQEQIDAVEAAINGVLTQVPFGGQDSTREALRTFDGRAVTEEQFKRVYNGSLDANIPVLDEGLRGFTEVRNARTGRYFLDYAQRKAIYQSQGGQDLLAQYDPTKITLGCRFERCFERGERNGSIAAALGLTAATILTFGETSPLLVAAVSTAAASFSVSQAMNACFSGGLVTATENVDSCSAATVAQTTVSQVNAFSCASNVALAVLDGVPLASALNQARRSVGAAARVAAEGEAVAESVGRFAGRSPEVNISVTGGFSDPQRVEAAADIFGDVTAQNARGRALIRAHNVAPEHGFGSYTQAELREKMNILMYDRTTEEIAALRAQGSDLPRSIYSQEEAAEIIRRGLAGSDSVELAAYRQRAADLADIERRLALNPTDPFLQRDRDNYLAIVLEGESKFGISLRPTAPAPAAAVSAPPRPQTPPRGPPRAAVTPAPAPAGGVAYRSGDPRVAPIFNRYMNGRSLDTHFLDEGSELSRVFFQSFNGDGEAARTMLADVASAGRRANVEPDVVRAFLRESFGTLRVESTASLQRKESIRAFILHVQQNYGSFLGPDEARELREILVTVTP